MSHPDHRVAHFYFSYLDTKTRLAGKNSPDDPVKRLLGECEIP